MTAFRARAGAKLSITTDVSQDFQLRRSVGTERAPPTRADSKPADGRNGGGAPEAAPDLICVRTTRSHRLFRWDNLAGARTQQPGKRPETRGEDGKTYRYEGHYSGRSRKPWPQPILRPRQRRDVKVLSTDRRRFDLRHHSRALGPQRSWASSTASLVAALPRKWLGLGHIVCRFTNGITWAGRIRRVSWPRAPISPTQ